MRAFVFSLLVLMFLAQSTWAAPVKRRFRGNIFSVRDRDFITERVGTTYPQFQILWKKGEPGKDICKSRSPGKCARYEIEFKRKLVNNTEIFADAKIVDPVDDPLARIRYLNSVLNIPRRKTNK